MPKNDVAGRRPGRALLVAALLPLLVAACHASPRVDRVGSTAGGAQPRASAAGAATGTPAGRGYLDRLPAFGTAPPAHPVALPVGGGVPSFSRVPTDQPVAFITIDDGWVKHPRAEELLRAAHVPVTLFLTIDAIKDDPGYFARLRDAGAVIESHTMTHPRLAGRSYAFQRNEICGATDRLADLYGRRPTLFRSPFGEQDATTLRAVRDCGLKAALTWRESAFNGRMHYQEGRTVRPGDIILMHFRDQFVDDFIAILRAVKKSGLTPAALVDYLP
ncbi:polysaccharide deacetylase family protein [Rhizomonospora bruguierae]|uniref:polysaccharide deacetylase family protein n=1 Tax=Rhizomonospora bruguierae TaxID=1581705 RepID=UPI001BCB7983|nr:polysaccharide deacetylase family protein [Micromonospora sp. NBRC 107566]